MRGWRLDATRALSNLSAIRPLTSEGADEMRHNGKEGKTKFMQPTPGYVLAAGFYYVARCNVREIIFRGTFCKNPALLSALYGYNPLHL